MDPADTPRPRAAASLAVAFLAVGAAVVLLAGQPAYMRQQIFSSGATLRAVLLALLTAVALYFAWTRRSPRPALGIAATLLLLAPLGIFLLSLPAAGGSAADALRHAGLWALLALLPYGLLGTWSDTADAARTLNALVYAGVVAALLVLLPFLSGAPSAGPFGRPGVAGATLAALAGAALIRPPRSLFGFRGRIARYTPFALIAAACAATHSRTAAAALVLGALAALAAGAATARNRRRLRMALALTAALGAIVLGLMVEDVLPFAGSRKTVEVRLGLHRASLDAVGARPVTGHGAGSFATVALKYRDLAEARLEPRRRADHAHMDTLHAAVEGGVPAALLFLVFLGGLGLLAARASARDDGAQRRTRAAALGAIVALGVGGLGDGVLIDPAPVLVLAVAVAAALVPARAVALARAARPGTSPGARLLGQALPVLGALFALGACYVFAADALSDRELMRYRHAIEGGTSLRDSNRAARRFLAEGALRWRADNPEALYRLGVQQATANKYGGARETFHRALRADPGMTEARLDLAQVYQLEERYDDARAVLEEAREHDPTRYDLPRRLMEIATGPEPVPGDPPTPMDRIEVMRWMNEAERLSPERFEIHIDRSRFERRTAASVHDLRQAGAWVRQALKAAPGKSYDPPAEVLIESFRLAEAEGKSSPLFHSALLVSALQKNPRPARRFGAEAARFLDAGQERVEAALVRAGGDPANLDMRAANRAFDAAAVRMTALLYAGQENPDGALALARLDRDAGHFRRALARYRSLLAWTLPKSADDTSAESVRALRGPARLEEIAREGDLLLEAAKVAQRVDRPLANFYRIRGQLRIAFELLEKGQLENAERKFRSVLGGDADMADAHYGLARVLALRGAGEEAEAELIAALRLKKVLRGHALAEPDLAKLRDRPEVRLHLGIE